MVNFTGIEVEARSRLTNYADRPGSDRKPDGIKFWVCKSLYDSDSDVTGNCYPTFNDVMRVGGSDTDSDIPGLIRPDYIRNEIRGKGKNAPTS